MAQQNNARKQVRNFVLIWMFVTLLMGACTFAAIYTAYGIVIEEEPDVQTASENTVAQSAAVDFGVATQVFPTRPPTEAAIVVTSTPQQVAETQPQQQEAPVEPTEVIESTDPPTPTVEPTMLPVNNKEFQLGIQVQITFDSDEDLWLNEVEKLGMEWMKKQVRWENVEREKDVYDWAELDKTMSAASERGIKVLLSVVTAPDWAREPGADTSKEGPPANTQDYAEFITKILDRYPGQVHAIEIWNEQNLDKEWTSTRGIIPANYVELLRVSYQTIKDIDPGIVVISGALSPTGVDNRVTVWNDFAYMDAMIAAGMLNYTDCVGAHHNGINVSPDYTWDSVPNDPTAQFRGPWDTPHHSWSFRSTLQGYDLRIKQAGGDQKLCVTEFGWASTEDLGQTRPGFEFAADNSLDEQAQYTIQAINNMKEWDIVQIAILWNLNYGPLSGWDPSNDNVAYSIIGKDWNFRPVYGALQEWTAENQ